MNFEKFYNSIRKDFALTTENVSGFDFIIKEAIKRKVPRDFLAYILATVWHETAYTMQPIRESGGEKYLKSKKYYPYVGMGYVQLTWKTNYEKATKYFKEVLKINVDFVKNPNLLLNPNYAVIILFVGMQEGWFTSKDLDDYIDNVKEDEKEDLREFSNARRIINGIDKQIKIGGYAIKFQRALIDAFYDTEKSVETIKEVPSVIVPKIIKPSVKAPKTLFELIADLFKKIFGGK